ncbi:P-loop containing nucleoside triphosphate hydrolase protein [Mycena vulgaris]|nr:P-loop containing nucleoside triphosphate hydrolase protein [Mycena vulgaris]
MLPGKPKIFHGRDSELYAIVESLSQQSSRIAILGAGGMGKTSLAKAVLHHPEIATRYQNHFFVATDSAMSVVELAAHIGTHIGLNPAKDLRKAVLQHFHQTQGCLLILDNLETSWEPMQSRGSIEEYLSQLTDIQHLGLIITMRGAERPAKVRWTRPFLLPLKPLTNEAARQTFIEIADDCHEKDDINKVLLLTGNMPLAVNLIAHSVDNDGCPNVLARWEMEKTSMLSEGYDKRSNLEMSIALSLSSPRIVALPGSKELLSLLSVLPDGLSNVDLLQSKLPIKDVLECKTALLRTALAYTDTNDQLKVLIPIREYTRKTSPPPPFLVHPVRHHFSQLLDFYIKYCGMITGAQTVDRITLNLGNISSILFLGLQKESPQLEDSIRSTMSFNKFSRIIGHHRTHLMDLIPEILPQPTNHYIELLFIYEMFGSQHEKEVHSPENLLAQGQKHLDYLKNTRLEGQLLAGLNILLIDQLQAIFYNMVGNCHTTMMCPKLWNVLRWHSLLLDQVET